VSRACWPYVEDTPHCGRHCPAVKEVPGGGEAACVWEPHAGDVHCYGTPPCDPKAAVPYALSTGYPERDGTRDGEVIDDETTGHRWEWSAIFDGWADLGPCPN